MISALLQMQDSFAVGYVVEVVDVDQDTVLERKWGDKVPVLLDGDIEICHHFLDAGCLSAHLEKRA
jgi:hypothetical protein